MLSLLEAKQKELLSLHSAGFVVIWLVYSAVSSADVIIYMIYRVSQEECEILLESVPYVKLYRYNPKHLYPKLNGYGDNGQRSLKL